MLDKLDVNIGYLVAYVACYGLGVWQTTYALGGNGQTTAVFEHKFGWDEDETRLYNTVITTGGIVGLTIGCFLGGWMIKYGRRKTAIISHLIAIVGACICMIGNTTFLTLGRVLTGIAAGNLNVVFGKMINENFPDKHAAIASMMHNGSVCIGFTPAFLLGSILPETEDVQGNKDDENWRIIFMMPALIGIASILLILFVFDIDPIIYCIMTDNEKDVIRHMKRVYRKKNPDSPETIEEILDAQYNYQKQSTTMDASSTTFKQALCGKKYRKATWIAFWLNCFNQFSGINAINVYTKRMIEQMIEQAGEDSFPMTPLEGTYVIAATNGIAATLAIFVVQYFGRRPIFIVGAFAMTVFLFLCGLGLQ